MLSRRTFVTGLSSLLGIPLLGAASKEQTSGTNVYLDCSGSHSGYGPAYAAFTNLFGDVVNVFGFSGKVLKLNPRLTFGEQARQGLWGVGSITSVIQHAMKTNPKKVIVFTDGMVGTIPLFKHDDWTWIVSGDYETDPLPIGNTIRINNLLPKQDDGPFAVFRTPFMPIGEPMMLGVQPVIFGREACERAVSLQNMWKYTQTFPGGHWNEYRHDVPDFWAKNMRIEGDEVVADVMVKKNGLPREFATACKYTEADYHTKLTFYPLIEGGHYSYEGEEARPINGAGPKKYGVPMTISCFCFRGITTDPYGKSPLLYSVFLTEGH
jgi:hypothetical protein